MSRVFFLSDEGRVDGRRYYYLNSAMCLAMPCFLLLFLASGKPAMQEFQSPATAIEGSSVNVNCPQP